MKAPDWIKALKPGDTVYALELSSFGDEATIQVLRHTVESAGPNNQGEHEVHYRSQGYVLCSSEPYGWDNMFATEEDALEALVEATIRIEMPDGEEVRLDDLK